MGRRLVRYPENLGISLQSFLNMRMQKWLSVRWKSITLPRQSVLRNWNETSL